MYKNKATAQNTSIPEEQISPLFVPLNLTDQEIDLLHYILKSRYTTVPRGTTARNYSQTEIASRMLIFYPNRIWDVISNTYPSGLNLKVWRSNF
jgi:hypothetical protein